MTAATGMLAMVAMDERAGSIGWPKEKLPAQNVLAPTFIFAASHAPMSNPIDKEPFEDCDRARPAVERQGGQDGFPPCTAAGADVKQHYCHLESHKDIRMEAAAACETVGRMIKETLSSRSVDVPSSSGDQSTIPPAHSPSEPTLSEKLAKAAESNPKIAQSLAEMREKCTGRRSLAPLDAASIAAHTEALEAAEEGFQAFSVY